MLYFRTDQVDGAPTSWEDVDSVAAQNDGLVFQGASYEGLTVHFLELLFAAGGSVLSDDGREATIDGEPARRALEVLASGIDDGAVPEAVTTYMEEEARRAFEAGRASFMRNWPYAYALGQQSKIRGKFAVAPLPGLGGEPGAGILGGYDLGISAYSKAPEAALAFVQSWPARRRSASPASAPSRRPERRPTTSRRFARRCRSRSSCATP